MDDTPQTEHGSALAALIAPVGRRVLGRHARLMRASGLRLGEAVAARHEPPEAAKAARRLAPVRLVTRTPAAAPAAPGPAAAAPEPAGTESTIMPGLSDWGAEYLFGDPDAAVSTGQAWMGGAGLTPRTPEERRLSRIKRGGPEVARAAKILEGGEPPPAAGAKRLARQPAPDPAVASSPIRTTDNPTPESAPMTASGPAAEPAQPTLSRHAHGETSRPTVARTVRGEPTSPASEPAAGSPVSAASPPSEPAVGETSGPTVARTAGEPREAWLCGLGRRTGRGRRGRPGRGVVCGP